MTTAELVHWFQRRRRCDFRAALARAESIVIRRTLRPDAPRGPDKAQLRLPFSETKRHTP